MQWRDLFSMASRGLVEQKLRTGLTLIGVVIATVLMLLCLAAGEGVQQEVVRQFSFGDRLRRVQGFPGRGDVEAQVPKKLLKIQGDLSEAKRKRIRRAIIRHWKRRFNRPNVPLDGKMLRKLEALPHVTAVEPEVSRSGTLLHQEEIVRGRVHGLSMRHSDVSKYLVAGRMFSANDAEEILVHEYVAYRWGYRSDEQVEQLVGQTVQLEFGFGRGAISRIVRVQTGGDVELSAKESQLLDGIVRKLPQYLHHLPLSEAEKKVLKKAFQKPEDRSRRRPVVTATYRVVGVFRDPKEEKESKRRRRRRDSVERQIRGADALLPLRTAEDLYLSVPHGREQGFYQATVLVDENEHVEDVVADVKQLGLNEFSLTEILERVRLNIRVISYVMAVLAAVALFVAGLGIANTMVMTVMERTHEIGVMKALGARDADVQRIFLIEGGLIGFLGGGLGLLIGWASSFPINSYVVTKLENDFREPISDSIFAFPLWLVVGIPLFAALITTLASVYPARRAAKVDPIQALRHE